MEMCQLDLIAYKHDIHRCRGLLSRGSGDMRCFNAGLH